VQEYRVLLAEKLLSRVGYDVEKEIKTIELLKLRFGESALHICEIMLKDIQDSRRINNNIKKQEGKLPRSSAALSADAIDSTILSHLFWPNSSLQSPDLEKLQLPLEVQVSCGQIKVIF
jgi:anaphase-promoting complex subunit 2